MCIYCEHAKICGDTIYCTINHREPTLKEYNDCNNYKLNQILQNDYDLEHRLQ